MSKHHKKDKSSKIKREQYEIELRKLQAELCALQAWVKAKEARIILLFEGRDGAGHSVAAGDSERAALAERGLDVDDEESAAGGAGRAVVGRGRVGRGHRRSPAGRRAAAAPTFSDPRDVAIGR